MSVAHIPLSSRKKAGLFAVIDGDDYDELSKYRWHPSGTRPIYAARSVRDGNRFTQITMHRHLLKPPPDRFIDHANGDGLDNRKSNIRVCTASDNQRNRTRKKVGSPGYYVGVHKSPTPGKWLAFSSIGSSNGKSRYLGTFDTPDAAYRAYCENRNKVDNNLTGGSHG